MRLAAVKCGRAIRVLEGDRQRRAEKRIGEVCGACQEELSPLRIKQVDGRLLSSAYSDHGEAGQLERLLWVESRADGGRDLVERGKRLRATPGLVVEQGVLDSYGRLPG